MSRTAAITVTAVLAAISGAADASERIGGYDVGVFDRTAVDRTVTRCDALAAYADDDERVSRGVAGPDVKLAEAIAACESAVEDQPQNPRLHYQLSRLYGYRKDAEKAMGQRRLAVAQGYPIALFVAGFELAFPSTGVADPCAGAELMQRAAAAGSFAGRVGYSAHWLAGNFAACPAPKAAELLAGLTAARAQARGHFEQLLVESLAREITNLK